MCSKEGHLGRVEDEREDENHQIERQKFQWLVTHEWLSYLIIIIIIIFAIIILII